MKKISTEEYAKKLNLLNYYRSEYDDLKEELKEIVVEDTFETTDDIVEIIDVCGVKLMLQSSDSSWSKTKNKMNVLGECLFLTIEDGGFDEIYLSLNFIAMKKIADYLNHKIEYLEAD